MRHALEIERVGWSRGELDLTTPSGRALAGMLAVFAEYAEPAVMRSRELYPGQNTARYLKVSNFMSVWRYA